MALQPRPDGTLTLVAGGTRSGKTEDVVQRTAREQRLLAWDAKNEWWHRGNCRRITDPRELARVVVPGAKLERIAYVVPVTRENFDRFCRLAWVWLCTARGALIVEEVGDVTSSSKAPEAWGEILRKGLAYGPSIYVLSQRPAESDKTTVGNLTHLRCFQMAREEDEAYMARELRVEQSLVAALKPLQWIERNRLTKEIGRGTVKIRASRSVPSARASAAQR